MKVRYFAWMKRTVGVAEEEIVLPADVRTVGELVEWLRTRSSGHAEVSPCGDTGKRGQRCNGIMAVQASQPARCR